MDDWMCEYGSDRGVIERDVWMTGCVSMVVIGG